MFIQMSTGMEPTSLGKSGILGYAGLLVLYFLFTLVIKENTYFLL